MRNKNFFLYLSILIPILMIAVVALFVFFPGKLEYPKQSFLYALMNSTNDDYYDCQDQLKKKFFPELEKYSKPKPKQPPAKCNIDFYIYSFTPKTITKITLEQAEKLKFSSKNNSIDGFHIYSYCSAGSSLGWWWGGSAYNDVCLSKKQRQERINIGAKEDQIFVFIGWIASPNMKEQSHATS